MFVTYPIAKPVMSRKKFWDVSSVLRRWAWHLDGLVALDSALALVLESESSESSLLSRTTIWQCEGGTSSSLSSSPTGKVGEGSASRSDATGFLGGLAGGW